MEALVYVSVISGIFTLLAILVIHLTWRDKWRHNYELEKYKARKRAEISKHKTNADIRIKNPAPTNPLATAYQLLPILKELDVDQIKTLADTFLGKGGYESEGKQDVIKTVMDNIPPDLIMGFIQGLSEKEGGASSGKYPASMFK